MEKGWMEYCPFMSTIDEDGTPIKAKCMEESCIMYFSDKEKLEYYCTIGNMPPTLKEISNKLDKILNKLSQD